MVSPDPVKVNLPSLPTVTKPIQGVAIVDRERGARFAGAGNGNLAVGHYAAGEDRTMSRYRG